MCQTLEVDLERWLQRGEHPAGEPVTADSRIVRNYQVAAEIIGWAALVVGLAVLIVGWWLGVEPLRRPIPGAVAMKGNTAFAFVLVGLSLVLCLRGWARLAAVASAWVAILIAIVTLVEYAVGAGATRFDTLLADDPAPLQPGRMSVITALCFLLLGIGLTLLVFRLAPGLRQAIGVVVQVFAFIGIFGYILDKPELTSWGSLLTPIAIHTAILMLLLGSAVVMAEPGVGWARVIASPLVGGRLFRTLSLPVIVIVVVMSDAVDYLAEHFQGGHQPLGEALSQLSWLAIIILLVGLLFFASTRNDRIDEKRQVLTFELLDREEQLSKTAQYARSLIEASLDPLVTISPEGKITDLNAATERITGHSRAKLIGTDFSGYFTSPEDARTGYERVFRDGQVVDYPLELRHKSGRVTPVLYNAAVYRNEKGEVIGVFAAARDIAERRLAENRIRQQSREIMELSTPVIQIWEGIVVVPLIGTLDSQRSGLFMERLLDRIVETNSPWALVDVTGVPTIDTQTAQHLLETISAVRLLGAQVVLTGVRPAIAQTLVRLGVDLSGITTRSTMAAGLKFALEALPA